MCDLEFSSSDTGGHGADALLLQVELLAPAVTGTMNVLKACSQAQVKRVVVVSSLSAVMVNPEWGDRAMDEGCWSDVELCRTTEVRPTSPMLHLHVWPPLVWLTCRWWMDLNANLSVQPGCKHCLVQPCHYYSLQKC